MQLPSLVPEKKLCAAGVELEIVDLGVVRDVCEHLVGSQVLDAKGQSV